MFARLPVPPCVRWSLTLWWAFVAVTFHDHGPQFSNLLVLCHVECWTCKLGIGSGIRVGVGIRVEGVSAPPLPRVDLYWRTIM